MAHLYKFGIENFRVFADYTEFEFAPITILTGPNNSGKSSLIKGLKLLKSYLVSPSNEHTGNIDYSKGDHNLGQHSYVVNNPEKPIRFVFPSILKGVNDLIMVTLDFTADSSNSFYDARLINFELSALNSQEKIFIYIPEAPEPIRFVNFSYFIHKMNKFVEIYINDPIKFDKSVSYEEYFHKMGLMTAMYRIDIPAHNGKLFFFKHPLIISFYWDVFFQDEESQIYLDVSPIPSIALFIRFLYEKGLINSNVFRDDDNYNYILDKERLLSYLKKQHRLNDSEIEQLIKQFINYFENKLNLIIRKIGLREYYKSLKGYEYTVNDLFEQLNESSKIADMDFGKVIDSKAEDKRFLDNFASYVKSIDSIIDSRTFLNHFRDSEKNSSKRYQLKFKKSQDFIIKDYVGNNLSSVLNNAAKYFDNFYALESIRTAKQRIIEPNSSESSINTMLSDYIKLEPYRDEKANNFLRQWLHRFGLTGSIDINKLTEEVGILFKLNKRSVSDLGNGINQLLPILIKIINIYAQIEKSLKATKLHPFLDHYSHWGGLDQENASVLIIEEPEANLHPRLQSLLADMFIDANKEFNIQFIVETHSEYLIRKLQYLTAEGKEIAPSDTAIYYFHDPNNVPEGEKQVKRINILEDGRLSDNFGPGFYDEALDLSFNLMRVRSRKHK